ncbi:hypothetical protein ACFYPC_33850 [Streptomyces sp. NPDC005808]|uniref:hypothetical protein n=1 Tax=Streptomyces sp. NPDC005808 TaxID=3364734 RepID=UPI0036B89CF6
MSDDVGMTINMQNFGVTWTDASGSPRASTVAYDKRSAERRKTELEEAGATRIEIVSVKPGERPEPQA